MCGFFGACAERVYENRATKAALNRHGFFMRGFRWGFLRDKNLKVLGLYER